MACTPHFYILPKSVALCRGLWYNYLCLGYFDELPGTRPARPILQRGVLVREKLRMLWPVQLVQSGVSLLLAFFCLQAGTRVFLIALGIWAISVGYVLLQQRTNRRSIYQYLQSMGRVVCEVQTEAMTEFPFPVMVVKNDGEIVWYNKECREVVLEDTDRFGDKINEIIPELNLANSCPSGGVNIRLGKKMLTLYYLNESNDKETMTVLYFIDDHDLKYFAHEYQESRPVVMILLLDNAEELFQDAKENERGRITSEVEGLMERYIEKNGGFVKRLERGRYLAVVEERTMRELVAGRFTLLDEVRAISTGNKIPPTISIGVGREAKSYREAELMARQALDMALGRGGDQAAVKTKSGYEFYGGMSKGIEKQSKVRSRIVAAALAELVHSSENVLIMGHRFGDLDSLGASVGMLRWVELTGKPANIVMNTTSTLALPLADMLYERGFESKIIPPEAARELLHKDTLLIIVDTHISGILEAPDLYSACRNVVVIDHHRKMVGHIDNAVIFYHEPFASSTCEMVAELTQHLGEGKKIGTAEAEAMLAGIMLDTKNFTLRTGVRTFEAAAYLRRMGADTVNVRKLFVSSMDIYRQKTRLVASAEIYQGCAIAAAGAMEGDMRILAAQAADELLFISGVEAAFVIIGVEQGVSISARSMGAVNVQLIMERLGGGGHNTMAGAQFADKNIQEADLLLRTAITEYYAESTPQNNIK